LDELAGVSGPGGMVRESAVAYTIDETFEQWGQRLRRRWKKKSAAHDEMELAVRILFPDEADKVLRWLNQSLPKL
jgi:hypothetical protein